jgi:hypothetical protein|nr:MAG TPA: hypothetical protein [Caudoviricetes sp.]
MRDKILDSMRRSDCILGVVPDHGGMWLSPLRMDTPRNFKKTGDVSWTWTGFSAASNVIGSDDFEFEVIYRLNALQNPNYIFYHSDTQGSVNVGFTGSLMYLTIGRVQNPETGTKKNAGALQSDFAEFSAIGEWVSVVIRRVSGVLSLILNGRTTNTTTVDQTDVWYSDFDPISNFDGNMRSAKLLNLTTGETVWSASRAELYETQNPWPSDNPDTTPGISEAERVGLLTFDNIRTDRGVFEAADTSKAATIATQLTGTPETFLVFGDDGGLLDGAALPGGVFTIPAGTKIRALIGFDRALTAAEIAALS